MSFKIKPICLLSLFLVMPTVGIGGNIVNDSFESADMKAPGDHNFIWRKNNNTSVVTMDPDPRLVWDNGPEDISVEGRSWTAFDGDHSLRFRYPGGSSWTEQRFDIGEAHPELWMSFWLRVPDNFYHNNSSVNNNNKLLALWMDGYSNKGDGGNVVMEYRPDGNGGSRFYVKVGSGRYTVTGVDQGYTQFISVPRDRGRWMNIVINVEAESSEDAKDGTVKVWRRWEGEDYQQTHSVSNQPIRLPKSGPQGFREGYVMGWANSTFSEDTEFLVDDFKLSTESLLNTRSRPSPPQNPMVD